MPEYIYAPVETDPDALAQRAFDFIQTRYPDWKPEDSNFEAILIEGIAHIAADIRDLISEVTVAIFKKFGSLFGVDPIAAAHATADSTWTMRDSLGGYVIPAGTLVGIPSGGDLIPFETTDPVEVPPGSLTTGTGEVTLIAVTEGTDANDLDGTPVLMDALDFVEDDGIALEAPTANGLDDEDPGVFLNRLRARLQLMTPRPILARDGAILARDIPGVWRAVAIDGYNPGDDTYNNEKYVAIAAMDEEGAVITTGGSVGLALDEYLEEMREVQFVFNVIEGEVTLVDITYEVTAVTGWELSAVEAYVDAALGRYLESVRWGMPKSSNDPRDWENADKVRYLDVISIISTSPGVDFVESATIGLDGGAQTAADHTLAGVAPIAAPGDIVGTVNAP